MGGKIQLRKCSDLLDPNLRNKNQFLNEQLDYIYQNSHQNTIFQADAYLLLENPYTLCNKKSRSELIQNNQNFENN